MASSVRASEHSRGGSQSLWSRREPPLSSALSTTLESFMPLKHPPETESSGDLECLITHFLGLLPAHSAYIHSNSCFLSTQTKHRIPFLEIIFFYYFFISTLIMQMGRLHSDISLHVSVSYRFCLLPLLLSLFLLSP